MTGQAQTPELQSKILLWRQKALDGTLTIEDMKQAIEALRADRRSAAAASDGARRKAAKVAIPSAATLLDELEGM